MSDLAAWLLEQITEDEFRYRRAQLLHGGADPNMTALWLAEWDAKRQIVRLSGGARFALDCHPDDEGEQGHVNGIDKCLRILAAVYADREGYRDEWKPEVVAS